MAQMAKGNRIFHAAAIIIVSGVLSMGPAFAQSLKELRARENQERALDREAAYTEAICGNSISASIDWRSAVGWPYDNSLVSSCDGALGALEALCRSKNGKRRAQRVTRFICAGDGAGPSLNGGVLRYGAKPGGNGFSATRRVLENQL